MNETEKFARMRIDMPAPEQAGTPAPTVTDDRAASACAPVILAHPGIDAEVRDSIAPAPGEPYRMVPATDLLSALGIRDAGEAYLDDSATVALELRLARLGLAMATSITGPLRLRSGDLIPVVESAVPRASRYSSITLCLYLIAWLLQADEPTPRDLSIIDPWIDTFAPKEGWGGTARGTLRWLLSRRLFMTHKRKLRAAKLRRYPLVRARLVDALLAIVADPRYATPSRMKRLQSIYTAIGLDPGDIHSDIHRHTMQGTAAQRLHSGKTSLDTSLLRDMARSTEQARLMLADVFAEEKPSVPAPAPKPDTAAELLRQLARKPEWSRAEADALARANGLTLGAMLERVNDFSFDKTGEAAVEDDGDTIYVINY